MSDQNNNNDDHSLENRPDFQVNTGEFFSSIPVLKKDKKKKDSFSFETFDEPEAEEQIHHNVEDERANIKGLGSYTSLLRHDSEAPAEQETVDQANAITQDVIAKNKEKWAKKIKQKKKKSPVLLIVSILVLLLLAGGGAGAYFLFFTGSETPPAAAPLPPPVEVAKKPPLPTPAKQPQPVKDSQPATVKTQPPATKEQPAQKQSDLILKPASSGKKAIASKQPVDDKLTKELNEDLDILQEVIKEGDKKEIKSECDILFKNYPNQPRAFLTAYDLLLKNQQDLLANEIFNKAYKDNPTSAVLNYMKGVITETPDNAIPFLQKALELDLNFYPAYLKLAETYETNKDWHEADRTYRKLLKYNPTYKNAGQRFLAVKEKLGQLKAGIIQYRSFLKEAGKNKAEIALQLLDSAQQLPDSQLADSLLLDLKSAANKYNEYQFFDIKNKAIYGKLNDDTFIDGFYPRSAREFHMIYLISQNRLGEIALIHTPPDEFPDFWKVYISWQKNDKYWKNLAKKANKKYKQSNRRVFAIITDVWLKKLKPAKARELLPELAKPDRPLLLFLLAEYYRKHKKRIKASILYRKALKDKITPYHVLIESFSSKY